MRAIGYQQPGEVGRADALVDVELPTPTPTGRDILVEVRAVSVNPVDTKVRKGLTDTFCFESSASRRIVKPKGLFIFL